MMVIYELTQTNKKRKYIVLFVVMFLVLFCASVYFQLLSANMLTVTSIEEMMALAEAKCDVSIANAESAMQDIYFGDFYDQTVNYVERYFSRYLVWLFVGVPITAPIWGSFVAFWVMAYKECKFRVQKFNTLLFALLPVCVIPLFVLSVDLWRWIACACFVQVLSVLYLLAKKDDCAVQALEKMQRWGAKHYEVIILIGLYCVALGRLYDTSYGLYIIDSLKSLMQFILS